MSQKVVNPNQKSNGFLWALLAVVLIAVAVIGYVVVSGRGAKTDNAAQMTQQDVAFVLSTDGDALVLKSANASDDTPVVELFEDYSCPHCADLAEATDQQMKQAIEDGKLIVRIRTLNFLDRGVEDGHSHKAGAAALAVAKSGDAKLYWNYRTLLMQDQAKIWNKWSNDDFATAAQKLGAGDEVVNEIKNAALMDEFTKIAADDQKYLEDTTGTVSSPRVLKDGKDITLSDNWVSEVQAS